MAERTGKSSSTRRGHTNGTSGEPPRVRVISKVHLEGSLDGVQGRLVEGWAWCPDRPEKRLRIVLLNDGQVLGECDANLYRADLSSAGIGDGKHAFSFRLPLELVNGPGPLITAAVKGSNFTLPGSPKSVVRSAATLTDALAPTSPIAAEAALSSAAQHQVSQVLSQILDTLEAQTNVLRDLLRSLSPPNVPGPAHDQSIVTPKSSQDKYGQLFDRARAGSGSYDIIFFSVIDWNFRIQRPQHLGAAFANLGFRVFYLSVQFGFLDDPVNGRFSIRAEPAPGVFEIQLKCSVPAPNIYNGVEDPTQLRELAFAVRELSEALNLKNTVAVLQFPSWLPIALALPGVTIVHDCLDHIAGFDNVSEAALQFEDDLLANADLVVTSSQYLHDMVAARRRTEIIRNGAEVDFFSTAPSTVASFSSKPVVGYFGAIADWFDVDLVHQCALQHPEWHFALIGSTVGADVGVLHALDNVELLGERPYSELPKYLFGFDVCIIPFKIVDLIKATNPVKVYEYLSSGKPVVSTSIPEVERIGVPLVYVAKTSDDFPALIERAMQDNNTAIVRKRRSFARRNSWKARAERYVDLIRETFPLVSVVILCYNNLAFTMACVHSVLMHSNYPNLEIICVNNGSSDETEEYLTEIAQQHGSVRVVNTGKNLGFAGGNNAGLSVAKGEYLIILNNDTYVTKGWIVDLIRPMRLRADVGMTGPVTNMIGNEQKIVINYANMEDMQKGAIVFTSQRRLKTFETDNLAFFCVAIKRGVIETVGLLDERFGLGFFEDDDYCRRVMKAGFRLIVTDDVFVHHHLSASFDELGGDAKAAQMEKSRSVFEGKWGKWNPHRYRVEVGFGE